MRYHIAYSMNWVQMQRNSEPDPKTAVMERISKQLIVMGKVNINLFPSNHSLNILPIYRLVEKRTQDASRQCGKILSPYMTTPLRSTSISKRKALTKQLVKQESNLKSDIVLFLMCVLP
jgi:hypothetical protein